MSVLRSTVKCSIFSNHDYQLKFFSFLLFVTPHFFFVFKHVFSISYLYSLQSSSTYNSIYTQKHAPATGAFAAELNLETKAGTKFVVVDGVKIVAMTSEKATDLAILGLGLPVFDSHDDAVSSLAKTVSPSSKKSIPRSILHEEEPPIDDCDSIIRKDEIENNDDDVLDDIPVTPSGSITGSHDNKTGGETKTYEITTTPFETDDFDIPVPASGGIATKTPSDSGNNKAVPERVSLGFTFGSLSPDEKRKKHGTAYSLTVEYWYMNRHAFMSMQLFDARGKSYWLWKPNYLEVAIGDAISEGNPIVELGTPSIRDKPFGDNNARVTTQRDGSTYDVKTLMLVAKLGPMDNYLGVDKAVKGLITGLTSAFKTDQFIGDYKDAALACGSEKMATQIEKNRSMISRIMRTMTIQTTKRIHLDRLFLDETIKRLMTTYYSKGEVHEWNIRAKKLAYKDGRPEDRIIIT